MDMRFRIECQRLIGFAIKIAPTFYKMNTLKFLLVYIIIGLAYSCSRQDEYVQAPFEGLDTWCTNDWWNRDDCPIVDLKVDRDQVIAFGIYTVANNTLKMTAQLFPLYPHESRRVVLEVKRNGAWHKIAEEEVQRVGWSAHFRIEDWNSSLDVPYRLSHGKGSVFEGLIRKDPVDKNEIVLAALSCNSNNDRGMRPNYIRNISYQDPDLLFFAGDQSYDHKEHTAAWIKFGVQFRDIIRNRPSITIPDDHDIGQGNLWGENGKKASTPAGDDGGYFYDVDYVKMVERCQTWHLPDPSDPTPVDRGIGVYYTNLIVGGVNFAILEDRKFKTGPLGRIPLMGKRVDLITDPDYDPLALDKPGLVLLGERQLEFLDQWGDNWNGAELKVVLSQTGFCGAAHHSGNIVDSIYADLDANGWPQTGRNKALRLIKKARAIHIAGDQHLATVVQHGIDSFRDGPWAFVVPAIVNDYWNRWWLPFDEANGLNHDPENPLPFTGDYFDGFRNRITMHAYANPETASNGAGYGLIRFNKANSTATLECWPRDVDVTKTEAAQFTGWPITVRLD